MEIINYQDGLQGTNIVGTFSIYWGPSYGMTFHGWKLIRGKHGPFIAGKSHVLAEDDFGKKTYAPDIEFSKEKKAAFDAKIMELLKPYVAGRENI